MLCYVEEGNNLILTRLTSMATLINTKQQSETTCFNTQILKFLWHLCIMRDARVEMPKERWWGKLYQRNQIYLRWTKPKILIGQGWPNCGSRAACGSSNLCMRLFELSEKLYICFLFIISIAKCGYIVKWYCGR